MKAGLCYNSARNPLFSLHFLGGPTIKSTLFDLIGRNAQARSRRTPLSMSPLPPAPAPASASLAASPFERLARRRRREHAGYVGGTYVARPRRPGATLRPALFRVT